MRRADSPPVSGERQQLISFWKVVQQPAPEGKSSELTKLSPPITGLLTTTTIEREERRCQRLFLLIPGSWCLQASEDVTLVILPNEMIDRHL
jgi:hypothetical protein